MLKIILEVVTIIQQIDGWTFMAITMELSMELHSLMIIYNLMGAADVLLGTHDFTSFCGNRHFKKSAVRTIYEIRIEEKKDELDISFTGNGFLQNMVRILTGTLLEVGTGKREVREMKEILEGRNRGLAGPVAAAKGLVLINVEYE